MLSLTFLVLFYGLFVLNVSSFTTIHRPFHIEVHKEIYSQLGDAYDSFTPFERLLFKRFADSVAVELDDGTSSANTYNELMSQINRMTFTRPIKKVNDQGKNMLVRLFPNWLLPMYKVLIHKPFPQFSAWMNCWVTHWTTNWLMGKSDVYDLILPDGSIGKELGLKVEKCRFLESTRCVRTCLYACKVPTQSFFMEEMGLPVTLRPNMTDYSCKFEFGITPVPLEQDDISKSSCLAICTQATRRPPLSSSSSSNRPCSS